MTMAAIIRTKKDLPRERPGGLGCRRLLVLMRFLLCLNCELRFRFPRWVLPFGPSFTEPRFPTTAPS